MIRAAVAADYAIVMTLMQSLGVDDPAPDVEAWLRELVPRTLVAESDGGVVGYATFSELATAGYVHNLAVAPAAQNAGIGRALMQAIAARLRDHGFATWRLNVKDGNAPAIALYERLGFRALYRSAMVRSRWDAPLPDERAEAVVAPIPPADDEAIERAFGLLAGRLEQARGRGGRHLFQLRERGAAVGVGVFDPRFPGFAPFRVARPALAPALIDAARAHAPPDRADFGLMIENDEPLVATILAAGGSLTFRLIQYEGAIPA